jgi:NAD(P)-dependent dehydrogenase (short-subunit alcohol dehydrogenase family)
MNTRPNIVLVHGAWAEGSCWSGVIQRLQADGYHVTAPQFPLTTLADDVARLRQVLDRQDGPTIVVGHSYGGQVITALGADAPNAAGLVYIAAFGLDQGESLGALLSQGPVTPALAHLSTDKQGFGWLSEDDFVSHFAGDVDSVSAQVMYAVQQPIAMSIFEEAMGVPAWKTFGERGGAGAALYSASKHAVNGFTRSAALEVAATGIRVNAVAPGPVATGGLERFAGSQERAAAMVATVPAGRLGTVEDIADVITFLASDAARFMTGQIVAVNGGKTAA